MKRYHLLPFAFLILTNQLFSQQFPASLNQYIRSRIIDSNGNEIVGIVVPGHPPNGHHEPVAAPTRSAVLLGNVPAFDWCFGCSATSASMAAGYYDNNGYPEMYTGPTNGGVMPMDNSIWGTVVINGETRSQCPLSATRNTVDGRTIRGHVDDYWVQYNSSADDPYITNGWTEHVYEDCTGDFMGTNQSALGNVDGSTIFYNYTNGSPLYDYTGCEPGQIDGCHGLREFYESRGYTVVQNYSQYIFGYNGNTQGFTFNQYKNEIDSGRPVLIQLEGHTMLGFGYDDTDSTVYVHDTWDYNDHSMTWGGSYGGMQQYGVCVVELEPSTISLIADFEADNVSPVTFSTVSFTDLSYGSPTTWLWNITPGTYNYVNETSSSSQDPQVQFTDAGSYTVSLIISDGENADTATKTNYITATDCSNYTLPFTEDFSQGILPVCWSNVDNIGNGQAWEFDNPGNRTINTTTGSNGFAILDSDHYGSGNSQDADLISPSLDLSGYLHVDLYFEHYFVYYASETATLSYSVDGGSNWNTIQSWTATTANPEIFNQDISALVAGNSDVRFKWNYSGTYGWYWAVDDISITGSNPGLWRGYTSTDWNTGSNWDDGTVPVSTTNVIVSPTAENWPAYAGDFVVGNQCCNMNIPEGSEMTVGGNFTINPGCTLTVSAGGILHISGNWSNDGTLTSGSGTIDFNGSSNATINPPVATISNYSRSTFSKGMTALSGATLGPSGDDGAANVPIGFSFIYGSTEYTGARICTNGWLTLNQSGVHSYNNPDLFTSAAPNTTIAPWWDDLADDGTSYLYYQTTGTSPNRVFTVEWKRVKTFSSTSTQRISFQVKLYETTNVIEFHYGDFEPGTPSTLESASIGIEDATGGSNHFLEGTTGSATTGISTLTAASDWPAENYRFTPPVPALNFHNINITKSTGQIDFNSNTTIEDTLLIQPGASYTVKNGKTVIVGGGN